MNDSEIVKTIKRYNERYAKFGYSEKALGWSRNNNDIRFKALVAEWHCELDNSTVCDFGCGFGDFYNYLAQIGVKNFKYWGIDINETLITRGEELFPEASFWVGNILRNKFNQEVDFTFSSGVFNHKLESGGEYNFIEECLSKINAFSKKGFAINFLSNKVDYFTEHNFNSNPGTILDICYKFSPHIILRNDYMPYEFTVYVRKDKPIDANKIIFLNE